MENNEIKDENFVENDQEKFPESFLCCICLDLVYKPVVLSCGHVSCFWCVRKSMDGVRGKSHCPVCRNPYNHFPRVCQMLHFLLLKLYPVAYKRKENQTLVYEEENRIFSPQFNAYRRGSQAMLNHPGSSPSSTIVNPVANACSMESSDYMEQSGSASHKGDEGTTYQIEHHQQPKVLVEDVMCTMCKQLLFHPVVLNCGHVYCESCIFNVPDEMLRCQDCRSPHPRGFPKVCLALDQFLEERLPEEYAQQRELNQIKVKPETISSSLNNDKGVKRARRSDPESKVHFFFGCDYCGVYPINGDRYACVDCSKEWDCFDLCGDCYINHPNLPGRFNQQHSSEHRFKLMPCFAIVLGQFEGRRNVLLMPGGFLPADDGVDNRNNMTGGFLPADDSDDGVDNHNDAQATN